MSAAFAMTRGLLAAAAIWATRSPLSAGEPKSTVNVYHLKSFLDEHTVDGVVGDHASIARFCTEMNAAIEATAAKYHAMDEPEAWLLEDGGKYFIVTEPIFTVPPTIRVFNARPAAPFEGAVKIGTTFEAISLLSGGANGLALSHEGFVALGKMRDATKPLPKPHFPYPR